MKNLPLLSLLLTSLTSLLLVPPMPMLVNASTTASTSDYKCDSKSSSTQNCASSLSPNKYRPQHTPQFITITIEGPINEFNYMKGISKLTSPSSDRKHTNPNGSTLPITFYVESNNNDYIYVKHLYQQGHEMGVSSMTGTTSKYSAYDSWRSEILGCKNALVQLADVDPDDIVGFRAKLKTSGGNGSGSFGGRGRSSGSSSSSSTTATMSMNMNDRGWRVLHDSGFLYDASVVEDVLESIVNKPGKGAAGLDNGKHRDRDRERKLGEGGGLSGDEASFIWPYTFDSMGAQDCKGYGPERAYPGLWEVPMYSQYDHNGEKQNPMDYTGSKDKILAMFKQNFASRYSGNRAPFGIYITAQWLMNPNHAEALNDFLYWARYDDGNNDDVWFVTNQQLVQWMQKPHKIAEMGDFEPVRPKKSVDVTLKARIRNAKYCPYKFVFGGFHTDGRCPNEYPSPEYLKTHVVDVEQEGVELVVENCTNEVWDSTKVYKDGYLAVYGNYTYRARYWNKDDIPGMAVNYGPWEEYDHCRYTKQVQRSEVTPSMKEVRVVDGESVTFLLTPQEGYKVSSILVDGEPKDVGNIVTMAKIRFDSSLQIQLVEDQSAVYKIITSSGNYGGDIFPKGSISVLNGGSQSFNIDAKLGYELIDVKVNGNSKGAIKTFTFEKVFGDKSIEAIFERSKDPFTMFPTSLPTWTPSASPTFPPTNHPSKIPTSAPTPRPTPAPLPAPFFEPTPKPIYKKPHHAPTPAPVHPPSSALVPPTNNCKDAEAKFKAEKKSKKKSWTKMKTCKWVGKDNSAKKCRKILGAKENCPLTCGSCVLNPTSAPTGNIIPKDLEELFILEDSNQEKGCNWVKKKPSNRCNRHPARIYCLETCKDVPDLD